MAPPYLNTPRTDVNETMMSPDKKIGFDSEIASFIAPPNADQIYTTGQAAGSKAFMTPGARAPLARRRNLNIKPEFTPLLKSAAKNRMFGDQNAKENSDIETPGASRLKMSITASSPAFPENSVMVDSSITGVDHTPMIHESSSSMGTPIPALPRKGELGLNGDGNILTLKEQEARLEKIDKENFGLKLKIHFLEENLKRTGPEFNQQTIKENTELKANKVMLERDLKKYLKQLKQSEYELEQYRLQLEEYIEKVKRRHMDEALRDELDKYKRLAEIRAQEIQELKNRVDESMGMNQDDAMAALRDQIEDLEAELKDKQQTIDQKEDQIDELKANLEDMADDEKDEMIENQNKEIENLRDENRRLREQSGSGNEEDLEALKEEYEEQVRALEEKVENAERAKKEQLQEFSVRLQKRTDEYELEIETLQTRMKSSEQSRNAEIESLNMRLQLASSQSDNVSSVAQQAAADAHERLRAMETEKNAEIERLESRLHEIGELRSELRITQQQAHDNDRKTKQMEAELFKESQIAAKLRQELVEKEKEIEKAQSTTKSREDATDRIDRLELALNDKVTKITELERILQTKTRMEEDLRQLQSKLQNSTDEVEEKQLQLDDQQRQIESLQHTIEDRNAELEVLRVTPDEPESQIEGLQSIVRHRDEDLIDLRNKILSLEKDLGNLQKVADDRFKNLEDLRQEFTETKQDLEDEIEVLESSLDEAEERVKSLAQELQDTRSHDQERSRLQSQINELRRFQDIADSERDSLQSTIDKLRKELRIAKDAANAAADMSTLPKGTSAELRSLRMEQRDLRFRLEEAEAALMTAESKNRQSLQRVISQKDEKIRKLEMDVQRYGTTGAKVGKLSLQAVDSEKKHLSEMKGLVKQIQVLRARLGREKMFRGELAFQKRWFLMMVDMYDTCNASNIRMIEEMGISPDPKMKRKPSLKVAAQAIIFCLRLQKSSQVWAEQRKTQDILMQKMESIRARGSRRMAIRS